MAYLIVPHDLYGGRVMASEGPRSPGTMANVARGGATAWANVNNAKVSDDVYTTCAMTASYGDLLRATNFGFSIPIGATITGVVVEVENKCSVQIPTEMSATLMKAGTPGGAVRIWNSPATEAYNTLGSSGDLWTNTLSPADVNASGFGVEITTNFGIDTTTVSIDHIRITVYYTESGKPFRRSLLGVGF